MAESMTKSVLVDEEETTASPRGSRFEQIALIAAMFVGSVLMWAGAPAFWLWLAGQFSKVSSSGMNQYLMVIVGIPVSMVIIGKGLARLDHRYTNRFGNPTETHFAAARWLRSARGGGEEEPPSMLDKVLVVAVGMALLAVGIWFVFFSAGSQGPH
ncbi:MAG: hypothetical protein J7513_04270 [Solirubrobacteraceae bacterium]|nr:hypothetical protein [Solirubrobacteraceae bacterium]